MLFPSKMALPKPTNTNTSVPTYSARYLFMRSP
jgi:hypothetical protein